MKYLDNATFQVGGYSRKYSDNWDAIFGKKNDLKQPTEQSENNEAKDTSNVADALANALANASRTA